jgi:hypothetical protein
MLHPIRLGLALLAAAALGPSAAAQVEARLAPSRPAHQSPAARVSQADLVVLGKVVEVEKDPVEATWHRGAPKDQKVPYKVAVLKIDQALLGAAGLTQLRVGFAPDLPPGPGVAVPPGRGAGGRAPGPPPAVALTAGMEGCFLLTRHHDGEFHVLADGVAPFLKTDGKYAKDLEEVQRAVKAINDPVTALKAKDLAARFWAARILLERYRAVRENTAAREPVPDEENKLIVALLAELPWAPDPAKVPPAVGDTVAPSRQALWFLLNAGELAFKAPKPAAQKGDEPPADFNALMDEATAKFLKENADKIKIRRYVRK